MILRAPIHVRRGALDGKHLEISPEDVRVLYFGVGFGGKTSNLVALDRHYNGSDSGLKCVEPVSDGERRIVFDALTLRLGDELAGSRVVALSIPGRVGNDDAWRVLLGSSDGVVFVVDSQRERLDANVEAATLMNDLVAKLGVVPPIVFQLNKRDLPNAGERELLMAELGAHGRPCVDAVSAEGSGVIETLTTLVSQVRAARSKEPRPTPWWTRMFRRRTWLRQPHPDSAERWVSLSEAGWGCWPDPLCSGEQQVGVDG